MSGRNEDDDAAENKNQSAKKGATKAGRQKRAERGEEEENVNEVCTICRFIYRPGEKYVCKRFESIAKELPKSKRATGKASKTETVESAEESDEEVTATTEKEGGRADRKSTPKQANKAPVDLDDAATYKRTPSPWVVRGHYAEKFDEDEDEDETAGAKSVTATKTRNGKWKTCVDKWTRFRVKRRQKAEAARKRKAIRKKVLQEMFADIIKNAPPRIPGPKLHYSRYSSDIENLERLCISSSSGRRKRQVRCESIDEAEAINGLPKVNHYTSASYSLPSVDAWLCDTSKTSHEAHLSSYSSTSANYAQVRESVSAPYTSKQQVAVDICFC